ncbi:MAG: tRNA lysidine(34) synthetase TilS [Ectobacillus sp.]
MKDLFISKLDSFVAQNDLLHKGATVVVGVSGGPDSLALLYYLLGRKERDSLQIVAAHVDHMFRGEESRQDMVYVQSLCKRLGIPCEAKQINVEAYQEKHQLGAQVAARECRYEYLENVMKRYNADYLALGHHGDDQIETMLMRFVRGSTFRGYAGIPIKRAFATGMIIRPLLAVTKDEIYEYCIQNHIVPRVDPSNKKETYTRNRFRKHILPYLKKENPAVHERFLALSKFIQEDEDYLQELAFEKMNKVVKKKDKNKAILSIPAFESLPIPLQRRVIQLILNYLYAYKLPSSLSSIHIEQVLSFLKRPHPSGSLDFPRGLKIVRAYEDCSFNFEKEKALPFSCILPVPGTVVLPNGDELTAEVSESFPSSYSSSMFVGDSRKMAVPFTVRSRQNGDRMAIKGMKGTKKIKAIFIEEKVPRQEREEWPIVCDAKGNIVWIPLLKRAETAVAAAEESKGSYIIIHYKSKESSRRINR